MTKTSTLRKYLLDDLDDERKQAVEDLMFSDDDIFQRLCVLDDELVEAYLRGELSTADSQRLFRRLKASERGRRTLDFMVEISERARASAPATAVAAAAPTRVENPAFERGPTFPEEVVDFFRSLTTAPRAAMALCCLLVTAIALPFFRLDEAQRELAHLGKEKTTLAAQVEALENRIVSTPVQATFSLRPLVRAGESSLEVELAVAPETKSLELWLDPGGVIAYPELRAYLKLQGKKVWSADRLEVRTNSERGTFVPVEIPTRILEQGHYDLVLEGLAGERYREVARYPFHFEVPQR